MKDLSKGSFRISSAILDDFGKHWGFFLAWGVALTILGLLAISFSAFASLVSVILLGFFLLVSGILVLFDANTFWRKRGGSFLSQQLMGLLYVIAGLIFIFRPVAGSISITLVLGVLFVILGLCRIYFSLAYKLLRSGWALFSGIVTLILGILVLTEWPASGLFIIGLFVGIDLLFLGINYIMAALIARKV
jgi:uncharacterized membrane protein HdeD (DUF308 family)